MNEEILDRVSNYNYNVTDNLSKSTTISQSRRCIMTELVLVKTDQVYDYCLQLCDILDERFKTRIPHIK